MKLKLSHITPYAAHRLTVMYQGIQCELEGFDLHKKNTIIVERINVDLKEIKPILRPLSDLNKEININGKKIIPINLLNEKSLLNQQDFTNYEIGNENLLVLNHVGEIGFHNFLAIPLDAMQLLVKWHFDIFDLIKNKLAIDINTLKQTI